MVSIKRDCYETMKLIPIGEVFVNLYDGHCDYYRYGWNVIVFVCIQKSIEKNQQIEILNVELKWNYLLIWLNKRVQYFQFDFILNIRI